MFCTQVLAPRIGYLPLLVPLIKPYFKDSLPPGEDSIWFDYKGVPLKWYYSHCSICYHIIGVTAFLCVICIKWRGESCLVFAGIYQQVFSSISYALNLKDLGISL